MRFISSLAFDTFCFAFLLLYNNLSQTRCYCFSSFHLSVWHSIFKTDCFSHCTVCIAIIASKMFFFDATLDQANLIYLVLDFTTLQTKNPRFNNYISKWFQYSLICISFRRQLFIFYCLPDLVQILSLSWYSALVC